MATPSRNLILEDIATTLATITVGGGYKTTVDTVERVIKTWHDVGDGQRPWLGFAFIREDYEHHPGNLMRAIMEIVLVGHIDVATDAARSDELSDLIDDVIAVLNVDIHRGGNAIWTKITSAETDEGDPDTMDSRGGSGTFVMRAKIAYNRTTSST